MTLRIAADKLAALAAEFARLGIREDELTEKFVRAQGPGGQKVNKTSSAVYLRHRPTGIEVKAQTSRSQLLNRLAARRLLAARLAERADGRASAKVAEAEKIRRQKRRRSRRAKARTVADKRLAGAKKSLRGRPVGDD